MHIVSSVICGDMVKKAKPDPEIYQKASESLGIQPENCMAFEDAPGGIRSAYQAGMYPVMIPDLVKPENEVRKLAYQVLDSLEDVIELLEKNQLVALSARKLFFHIVQEKFPVTGFRHLFCFPSSGSPTRQHQSGICNRKSDLL